MIIVMSERATEDQIAEVAGVLERLGFPAQRSTGSRRTVLGVLGPTAGLDDRILRAMAGVLEVVRISEPWRLAGRADHPEDTIVDLGDGVRIGGEDVVLMAGPCAVEEEEPLEQVAAAVRAAGARVLRGGAWKPRTSPYSFQGLGEPALRLLRRAAERHGLKVVTEVMHPADIPLVSEYADLIQVGARNMQNFSLLKDLAQARRPVMLKRGPAATLEEWLLAAEYLLAGGNPSVVLCERGIRSFDGSSRNTLDLGVVPAVKQLSHLPVIVDPSHGTGVRDRVAPMAAAAIAAGADGVLIEVHHRPAEARSDGAQSITPEQFAQLAGRIRLIAAAVGRSAEPEAAPLRRGRFARG